MTEHGLTEPACTRIEYNDEGSVLGPRVRVHLFFFVWSWVERMRNEFHRMEVTHSCRRRTQMSLWQRLVSCLTTSFGCTAAPQRCDSRNRIEGHILSNELHSLENIEVVDALYNISLHTLQADDHMNTRAICADLRNMNVRATSEEKMRMLVRMLLKRIHQLDEVQSCALCMSKPRCAVMMPCAHLVTCDECACEICPICASRVETTLYVFPS